MQQAADQWLESSGGLLLLTAPLDHGVPWRAQNGMRERLRQAYLAGYRDSHAELTTHDNA